MKKSTGLAIIYQEKILLVHPTGNKWYGTYSIPKGEIEEGEEVLAAAIRETVEEIGVEFTDGSFFQSFNPCVVDYKNKKGIYKKVLYFIVEITDDKFIKSIYPTVPKDFLQTDEVDWAGWLTYEEAKKRIFWRQKPILDKIFG